MTLSAERAMDNLIHMKAFQQCMVVIGYGHTRTAHA